MKQSKWEFLAIDLLRNIEIKKKAYNHAIENIKRLNEQYEKVKGPALSTTPVSGGMLNREEERRLDNLADREELEASADILKFEIQRHEKAWQELTQKEKQVLDYFYITRPNNHIDKLCEILSYEQRQVYNIKNDAMYKYTMLTYGKY